MYNYCRAMLCISAAIAGMRCPSVRPSVCLSITFVSCAKTNKDIFEFFSTSGSQAILVFPRQTGWRYSDGNPLIGASNAGGVGKKRDSERISLFTLHTCLQCCKPYEPRNVKNKAATDGVEPSTHGGVRRPLFAQDDDEVFVTGSTLYAGDGGQPPGHNPFGHNSVFCCRRTL